jgi:hypothetical protein
MRYSRSRFAGGKVDEQTRHSASPLLGLNYLFRRSLIQLDRSAIQYSSVYNHIYNCPLDSVFVRYRGLIICSRATGTNLEHNCTGKEFRCEFWDCVHLCVSHPAIQHAADADDHAAACMHACMHACRSCRLLLASWATENTVLALALDPLLLGRWLQHTARHRWQVIRCTEFHRKQDACKT